MAMTLADGRKPGSGRPPSEATIIARTQPQPTPQVADSFILPNYSGIKEGARKDSAVSFLQTGDNISLLTNDAGYVTSAAAENWLAVSGSYQILADNNWLAVSGSYLTSYTETDPIWLSQSGSYVVSGGNISSFTNDAGYITSAGSENWLVVSGSYQVLADNNWLAVSGSYLTAETDPVWLAQSGSYILISASGSYQTHIEDTSNPHGENLAQTGLTSTGIVSGSVVLSTTDQDTSGSGIFRNMILDNTSGGYTASSYVQGTVLIVYA